MPASGDRGPTRQHERLGELLAQLRNERGVPQNRIALNAGIDGSTLSRLEKGERGVSREVLDRICQALGLDREDRLEVLVAADFLTPEAANLLADADLSQLGRLLTLSELSPDHAAQLRQYVTLALAHARALGYELDQD
jgi:transcriptional regulator with XRE-family HTH domain